MLGFSAVACKLAPRDDFIGWALRLREKNLPLVVDNPRLLILTRITIPNPGTAPAQGWTELYGITPVLIETPRYTGAVYRTSGWVQVVTTQGRGRCDRHGQARKEIRMRLLRRNWKQVFNRSNQPACHGPNETM